MKSGLLLILNTYLITRNLNVLFLQGYFSISLISPTPTSLPCVQRTNGMSFAYFLCLSVLMFSNMEMYFFTNIWIHIFFWFIKFRASSVIRYSIVVVSVVWNIPQKHHTIRAEVLPNDSEALLLTEFLVFDSIF